MDIETVKAANRLEDVIGESLTLTGTHRYRKTQEHDSLVIDTAEQYYVWNSQNESGDVIDWLQRRQGWDFREAVEWLCRRAHLELPNWSAASARQAKARRQTEDILTLAARYFVEVFWKSPDAVEYAQQRGWTEEVCRAAGLGFYDADRTGLLNYLRMCDVAPAAVVGRALLGIPARMLIYPHVRAKRVVYMSGRSIEGKRHHNLPVEAVGERKPYFNHVFSRGEPSVVVCEGQADAITWGQWGIPAVALGGCTADVALARELAGQQVYLGLDKDQAGDSGTADMADLMGPMCRILPTWDDAKDANDALLLGIDEVAAKDVMDQAATWVQLKALAAGGMKGLEREQGMRDAFALIRRMDDFQVATMRKTLACDLGLGLREFNALLKATQDVDAKKQADDDAMRVEERVVSAWYQEHLVESLYTPEKEETKLAVRFPDGCIEVRDDLQVNGLTMLPVSPHHPALKKSVLLPDSLGEYDSVKSLHREVVAFIHRYLDIDPFYEHLAGYYVLFSWMYDSFQVLPYLRALGDYGTGKTRFLIVIGSICYKPIFVAGATTTSPIFRLLNEFKGTLVLDEADFTNSDTDADIIKILNVGFDRTFDVQRAGKQGDGSFAVEFYEVFGPKVIATRRKFTDRALESRCLTKEMGGGAVRVDIPVLLPLSFPEESRKLRNKLLRYRLDHWRPAVEVSNEDVDRTIEPRLNQVTMSLKRLVEDPTLVEEIDRFIREYQRQAIADRGMTLAAKVLQALLEAYDQPVFVDPATDERLFDLSVNAITERTNAIMDEENRRDDDDDDEADKKRKRYELGVKRVGNIIRNELQLRTERDHSTQHRGRFVVVWDEDRIKALCARYGMDYAE